VNSQSFVWISVIAWIVAIIATFATQGNSIANIVVLLISMWLIFLGWRLNRQRGRL
jgi:threonine/homoserine/homoserine lactone efflux protein